MKWYVILLLPVFCFVNIYAMDDEDFRAAQDYFKNTDPQIVVSEFVSEHRKRNISIEQINALTFWYANMGDAAIKNNPEAFHYNKMEYSYLIFSMREKKQAKQPIPNRSKPKHSGRSRRLTL